MATLSEAFQIAFQHHVAGRLAAAEDIYRRILAAEPSHADSLHLLGVLAYQTGQPAAAAERIQQAIALRPDVASYYSNLGEAYRALGKNDEARSSYIRAIALNPGYPEALNGLGLALKELGRFDEAIACYRQLLERNANPAETHYNLGLVYEAMADHEQAIAYYRSALEHKPDFAAAHNNLGNSLLALNKLDEAIACYRRALALQPDYAEAYNNLGNALKQSGAIAEAVDCYRRALAIRPEFAEAYCNLGNALHAQGKPADAVACYGRALELKPDYAAAHNALGNAWKDRRRLDEARACFRRAVEIKPDFAEAHNNLGNACKEQGLLDDAIASYQRAIELKPGYADAQNNLATARLEQGDLDQALAGYRRAIELNPDDAQTHRNLVFSLQYREGTTAAELLQASTEFDRRHGLPLRSTWRPHTNSRDPERPLRLGFVSADFRRHPVGYFYLRPLEALAEEDCQVVCYATALANDDFAVRFRAAAHTWREVPGVPDEILAEQIRADEIDILFDTAGLAAGSRLQVVARKPAPIQIAWGSPTGLSAMDYALVDRYLIPPGAESNYRETPLRMPDAYACYEPPTDAPAVAPLPALERGAVTFGSTNNVAKITPQVIGAWAHILTRLPTSRLMIRCGRAAGNSATRERLHAGFARHGIDAGRVKLVEYVPYHQRLNLYQEIDLGLDPFPFSGCTTTCEALWMGVPVVTLPGETYLSRQSLSPLGCLDLDGFAAGDAADYVERAVAWAHDLPRLAALRAGLRSRMETSTLCDGRRFARNMMRVLRDAWRTWCQTPTSE
jgi:predicted O-linked N-acetylglucosamine transferase (SPINDLY family)